MASLISNNRTKVVHFSQSTIIDKKYGENKNWAQTHIHTVIAI
jgi:hypothetical protein